MIRSVDPLLPHIHTHTHTVTHHTHTVTHTYIHIYMYIYIQSHTYIHTYIRTYTHIYIYTHERTCTLMHAPQIYIYIYIYTPFTQTFRIASPFFRMHSIALSKCFPPRLMPVLFYSRAFVAPLSVTYTPLTAWFFSLQTPHIHIYSLLSLTYCGPSYPTSTLFNPTQTLKEGIVKDLERQERKRRNKTDLEDQIVLRKRLEAEENSPQPIQHVTLLLRKRHQPMLLS